MYKLVLKEKKLEEEKIGNNFYLYHATITKPDLSFLHSFRKGIRINASVGMAATQGAGFYLFQNYYSVLDRITGTALVNAGSSYRAFDPDTDGFPMVVTLEVGDLDPTKFNLDNELSYNVILEYIIKNIDALNDRLPPEHAIQLSKTRKDAIIRPGSRSNLSILPSEDISQLEADYLSALCDTIEKNAPDVWHRIEREMFNDANAIKYVGNDVIMPHKIEVMDGNGKMHDCTTKDPSNIKQF